MKLIFVDFTKCLSPNPQETISIVHAYMYVYVRFPDSPIWFPQYSKIVDNSYNISWISLREPLVTSKLCLCSTNALEMKQVVHSLCLTKRTVGKRVEGGTGKAIIPYKERNLRHFYELYCRAKMKRC